MTANETKLKSLLRQIEQLLNTPIPGTPTIGGRVRYVPMPGRGKNRANLTARAAQVMEFLQRSKTATADAICAGLGVNRNVVAGAMHELRQAKLVRSEKISYAGGERLASTAAEFSHRKKRPSKARKTSKK